MNENKILEEMTSYKYLGIDFTASLTGTITLRKGSMHGEKLILVSKIVVGQ